MNNAEGRLQVLINCVTFQYTRVEAHTIWLSSGFPTVAIQVETWQGGSFLPRPHTTPSMIMYTVGHHIYDKNLGTQAPQN